MFGNFRNEWRWLLSRDTRKNYLRYSCNWFCWITDGKYCKGK